MSTIKADTLSTLDGTKSITTDRVTQGVARAWVNFNGTGTVAIRASYNVSSITDNGTGQYTVNFTAAMPDANYSVVSSSASGTLAANSTYPLQAETYNTTSVQVVTRYNGASVTAAILSDILLNNVAIFR